MRCVAVSRPCLPTIRNGVGVNFYKRPRSSSTKRERNVNFTPTAFFRLTRHRGSWLMGPNGDGNGKWESEWGTQDEDVHAVEWSRACGRAWPCQPATASMGPQAHRLPSCAANWCSAMCTTRIPDSERNSVSYSRVMVCCSPVGRLMVDAPPTGRASLLKLLSSE